AAGGLMAATGGRGNGDGSAPTLNQYVLRRRRRLSAPALQAYSSSTPRTRTGAGPCDASSRVPVPPPPRPAAAGRPSPPSRAAPRLAAGLALAHVGLARLQAVLAQQLAQARPARVGRLADLDICAVELGADLFAVELHAHLDRSDVFGIEPGLGMAQALFGHP